VFLQTIAMDKIIGQNKPMPCAISFGSSGLLVTYHAGVALKLADHHWSHVLGCSGGAVVGLLLVACTREQMTSTLDYMLGGEWAKDLSWHDIWDPADRVLPAFLLRDGVLPPDAFQKATGRLNVCCTRLSDSAQVIFNSWDSNEDLVGTVQASCSFASHGVQLSDGEWYWDGGCASDAPVLPTFPDIETVTVSPVSGQGASISPTRDFMSLSTSYGDVCWSNFVRAWDCCIPRSRAVMSAYVEQGQTDAELWLAQCGFNLNSTAQGDHSDASCILSESSKAIGG